jgi:NAD(P)-dependent dehydrogenase (short-subunit alcohol dehydrogenase family)
MKPVVLITGGARGVGRAIATAFATDHRVAITYHSTPPAALLADHSDVHAIPTDLSEPSFAPDVVAAVIEKFGRIDVIVNNAGAIKADNGPPPP